MVRARHRHRHSPRRAVLPSEAWLAGTAAQPARAYRLGHAALRLAHGGARRGRPGRYRGRPGDAGALQHLHRHGPARAADPAGPLAGPDMEPSRPAPVVTDLRHRGGDADAGPAGSGRARRCPGRRPIYRGLPAIRRRTLDAGDGPVRPSRPQARRARPGARREAGDLPVLLNEADRDASRACLACRAMGKGPPIGENHGRAPLLRHHADLLRQ